MVSLRKCDKCHREIKKGSTSYNIHIIVRSHWDGFVEEARSVDEIDKEIEDIIRGLEHLPPSLIESDVHQKFKFTLCRRCKEIFTANPLNLSMDSEEIPDSIPPEL